MRQAIRALGWAYYIFWIILLFFTVTAVYSAFQVKPVFSEPRTNAVDGTLNVSIPFYLYNGGFYDISNLTVSTLVKDSHGELVSNSSSLPQYVPHGSNVSITHQLSINIAEMTTQRLSYLLFNDSTFDVDMALSLNYANTVPFKISTSSSIPWGAPISNLTFGSPTPTASGIVVPISFANHSHFELNGSMRLEIVDNTNNVVGQETVNINVPPDAPYGTGIDVSISGSGRGIKEARLYFQTSVFNYGPVVTTLA